MLWVHLPTDQAVRVQCNIGAPQPRGKPLDIHGNLFHLKNAVTHVSR